MDDQPIIQRVLSGDTEAFSVLVRRHQQMAFAVAMSVVKQEADARDVVQQAYLQAFTGLRGFRGGAAFSTWLCRIVINESLRFNRRTQKGRELEVETELPDDLEVQNTALKLLQREDQARLIRDIFKLMPPQEALVLQLFYLEEHSVKETAYCTSLTENHVKVLLSRARKRFFALCQDVSGQSTISKVL